MSQTYSFPVLSDQELLPSLKEMELPLNAAQLSKPTYEVVKPVYENIVSSLMGITREELQQPVFAAIDALEFPELHDESIPFIAFTKSLTRLMTAAGVKDFSLQDVCKPEPARLRRNLSAIINFAKFREEKLVPYMEMQEKTIGLLETAEELAGSHQLLADELRRIQEERAAEQPEVAAVEAATQEIYVENQALNKHQMALNNEVRALKNKTNTLTSEAADLKLKLQNTKQKAERLRNNIVESPEKLEATLKELQQAIERERSLTSEAERRARDLQTKLDTVLRVEKEVQKAMSMMEEVAVEIGRKKEASHKVKGLKAEVKSQEAEAAQLTAEHQHLQRQLASLKERLQRLEHQCELRKEAALSAVDEQNRNKEAIEAENAANIARMAEDEAVMRTMREKIKELQNAHDSHIQTLLDKCQQLKRQMFDYHEGLEAAMGLSDYTSTGALPVRAA